jgi:uncharacterized protein with PQ loop repeat
MFIKISKVIELLVVLCTCSIVIYLAQKPNFELFIKTAEYAQISSFLLVSNSIGLMCFLVRRKLEIKVTAKGSDNTKQP